MKKIVIISNYYPPEMGAAANRISNLAEALYKRGYEVSIISPLPNYPKGKIFESYKKKFFVSEILNNVNIRRCWIFPSKSKNGFLRLLSMLSFACSLWINLFYLLKKKPNSIIIQSPPLLVAFSGLLLSKVIRSKNILNVSDIWPLSALELGVIKRGKMYAFLEKVEQVNYKLADNIVGQSEETITHICKTVTKRSIVYRNVPTYQKNEPKSKKKGTLKIVYAGLLGYAQGILNLCEQIDFHQLGVEFHIYGGGMDEEGIVNVSNKENSNVFFHGMVSSDRVSEEIKKYDVGLVPLKNKIYGAVPSKIFELIQMGVPILFCGEGEGATIITKNELGLIGKSEDYNQLIHNIYIFKDMKKDEFLEVSNKCLKAHKDIYNLEVQMAKMDTIIS
ncbi:glycosyltransferase family 4 protein [uncultured Polaribacter sp.]|uniref:glycosyltransferase family 4 protein n=1 Tax=uncultured Polaribacter sp. TaxID=174711 RepID=UPI0026106BE7|nr:glycosyltransferase family 4 protein [uncultured Polaribacter sp.]